MLTFDDYRAAEGISKSGLLQRVFARCRRNESGCLEWQGTKPDGYGRIAVGRKGVDRRMALTHKVVYEACFGPVPSGLEILHSCDNACCCEPTHLSAGTRSENIKQAYARGLMKPHSVRGEHCSWSRLTTSDVIAIRELGRHGMPQSLIAKRFGVTQSHISRICRHVCWSDTPTGGATDESHL